jgi:hypothetical protein
MTAAPMIARPLRGTVGERKRQAHLFPAGTDDMLVAFCGAEFSADALERLDHLDGIPCEACLINCSDRSIAPIPHHAAPGFSSSPRSCPSCEGKSVAGPGSLVYDPLLATPFARLCAAALTSGIRILGGLDEEADGDLGGAVGGGGDGDGERYLAIWVRDDMPDDLRVDILAFGIAVAINPYDPIIDSDQPWRGIESQRLDTADSGPGHVAWHLAASCGHHSTSATFALVGIP